MDILDITRSGTKTTRKEEEGGAGRPLPWRQA